ncbi:MAG: hypothetical protein K2I06_12010 [Ruminococcus sp.]|nr:hypothetical protein [Ruminococcus sp.]
MIDKDEIKQLLNGNITDKMICHDFELRPSILAPDIKKLANITDGYGYIIIGAYLSGNRYNINGIARDIKIDDIIKKAINQLTVRPQAETCSMNINEKNIYAIKIYRIAEGTSFLTDKLNDKSINEFIERLYHICIKLQGNAKYINAKEDEHNDYIRDMLGQYDYVIKDQTRRGLSSMGISSGEVDILVEKDKFPFTIIEALNLKSLDTDYLAKHLNKIYTYDTTGNLFNVCLVYAELKNFASFWEKYCNYIKGFKYPYPIISVDENLDDIYSGSEIKIMTTTHNRSGQLTKLYHICVKILLK